MDLAEGEQKVFTCQWVVYASFPPEQLRPSLASGNHTISLNKTWISLLKRIGLKNVYFDIKGTLIWNYCILSNSSVILLSFKFLTIVFFFV